MFSRCRVLVIASGIVAVLLPLGNRQALAATDMAPPLPELRPGAGSPPQPTDVMLRVGRAVSAMRGDSIGEAGRMALDSAIVLYPEDPDARFVRAGLTFIRHGDLTAALADLDSALAHWGTAPTPVGTTLPTAYALEAQIELALGRDRQALAMIERAIRLNPANAENLFNPGTIDPDSTTPGCNWRKATLNALVARNPSDYRAHLVRGLYYGFFKRFNTRSHPKALQDLLAARRLAPSSALCAYLLGREYMSGGKTILGRLTSGTSAVAKQNALKEFTASISLERTFAPAYAERAELRTNLKQDALAIKDYDAVIKLEPDNGGAFNDRGLAEKALGNCWGAIHDFSDAARLNVAEALKGDDDAWTPAYYTFQSRAECNATIGEFSEAANDMSEAVRALLMTQAAAMSLSRLRDLFPECSAAGDDEFLHMIHDAFCPTMPYATFESLKRDSLLAQLEDTVVPSAYVQRGDYLLRAGDLRRALADYARARRAFPSSARYTERWRLALANDKQEFYIDSQAEPRPTNGRWQTIWIKVQEKRNRSAPWTIERMSVDCQASTIHLESTTTYGADGSVIASNKIAGPPSSIVPESIGEWVAKAICR